MGNSSISKIVFNLIALITLMGVVIAAGAIIYFYRFYISRLTDQYVFTLQTAALFSAGSYCANLKLNNSSCIDDNFLNSIARIPGVVFVRLIDPKAQLILSSSLSGEMGQRVDHQLTFGSDVNIQAGQFQNQAIQELTLSNNLGDNFWIGFSLEDLNREVTILAIVIGALILLLISVRGIYTFYVTRSIFEQPFTALTRAFEQLRQDDYSVKLSGGQTKEIEAVFQSFNQTAETLNQSIIKVKQQQARSDKAAELLLRRDLDLRQINDELENEKAAISAEKNKLATTLSGINDAVITLDLNRKIITFNAAAEKLTGLSSNQVLGKLINTVIRVFSKEQEITSETYCPPPKAEGTSEVVFAKDGLKITSLSEPLGPINNQQVITIKESSVNLISSQIKQGSSFNLGCILTLHDITEEKQLEEMKLDFVTMAAHELRTPLTSIRSYLSVFINENKPLLNKEQNMFLSRIDISAQQLVSLVENLLNVSKIERGVFTVNLQPMDWVTYVSQMVTDFSNRAKEKNLTLTFIPPQNPTPQVSADKTRIGEVLSNLIANAITYTPPGRQVVVSIETTGQKVTTHVADNGEGIPKEAIPHLFTKFFRVSGKLEQGSKGTGLGLYISKVIIQMHKGNIWVNSELGKGSTFSFSLPVAIAQTKFSQDGTAIPNTLLPQDRPVAV